MQSQITKILCLTIILLASFSAKSQFTIFDVYGDLTECDTMTRGGFIVWWDKDFDMEADAVILLDSLDSYRAICLDDLDMLDPPNPMDDYFYNIYVTNPADFFAPNGWGQGQGTDVNGYPFLTLPNLDDKVSVAHEIFHIFQYSATSPGFAYAGDSQWYIEAAANWFAARVVFSDSRSFIEAESLVRISHVPLWLSFDNFPADYAPNWQRYVHQYALALFLYYLTDVEDVSPDIIAGGLYAGTDQLPQEYFYNQIGASQLRGYFMDWAAHMTNNFDFISDEKRMANETEWIWYADLWDDNEYLETFVNTGTDGWCTPVDSVMTHAWSFNTYRLENTLNQSYRFEIKGDEEGSYDDPSFFDARLLVQGEDGTSFYDLNMTDGLNGYLILDLLPSDTTVYFIVGSIPEIFEDTHASFQKFSYEMQISTGMVALSELSNKLLKKEVARFNVLGQPITSDYLGVQIILYDDGSTKKIVRSSKL